MVQATTVQPTTIQEVPVVEPQENLVVTLVVDVLVATTSLEM